uniref:Uncharacterized protein n=1 Tax=Anguilla anguilla TaxID=7936 RepID=A0A0E9UHG9_ANGAN
MIFPSNLCRNLLLKLFSVCLCACMSLCVPV